MIKFNSTPKPYSSQYFVLPGDNYKGAFKKVCFLWMICAVFIIADFCWIVPLVHARSQISIEIDLDNETFTIEEPVTGKVIIRTSMPATFPANFVVKLFKDDELMRERLVNTPVFTGKTKYKLRTFGLGDINKGRSSMGRWHIIIESSGKDPIQARAAFSIVATEDERPSRKPHRRYIYN